MSCPRYQGFVMARIDESGTHSHCLNCGCAGAYPKPYQDHRMMEQVQAICSPSDDTWQCIDSLVSGRRCGTKKYYGSVYCYRHRHARRVERAA